MTDSVRLDDLIAALDAISGFVKAQERHEIEGFRSGYERIGERIIAQIERELFPAEITK